MSERWTTFSFEQGKNPSIGLTNFWPPEDGFVWSTSSWCELSLPINAWAIGAEIAINLDVFKVPPVLEGQNVFIYMNGLRLASRFISDRATILIQVRSAALSASANIITFDTPDAARPSDHGQPDTRRLGVQVFSVQVRGLRLNDP